LSLRVIELRVIELRVKEFLNFIHKFLDAF
jgi:hypothetical protein